MSKQVFVYSQRRKYGTPHELKLKKRVVKKELAFLQMKGLKGVRYFYEEDRKYFYIKVELTDGDLKDA